MQWRNPSPSLDHDACGTGFVLRLAAPPSREVVDRALVALQRLSHRGAVDAAGTSGDGAGLMTSVPEEFFRSRAQENKIKLPSRFAVGMVFLPEQHEAEVRRVVESCAQSAELPVLGWRTVPTNSAVLGKRALQNLPQIRQVFLDATDVSPDDLELSLFLLRKRAAALAPSGTYFCSLSARTVVYKGLLSPNQLADFYLDLMDPEFRASFAIFHQRFSTNTRPTWSLAQPFRFVAHNGEINTISGNRRWMRAREASVREDFAVETWFRSLEPDVSDSANFDNAFELLLRHRTLSPAAAMLRMVPPACEGHSEVPASVQLALARQAWQSEPWDGPAALIFSDGVYVGAKLDRNGLRPLRVVINNDGWLIAGSEAGLADFDETTILERSRLGPGEMLLAEIASGKLWRGDQVLDLLPKQDVAEPDIQFVEPQINKSRRPRQFCKRKSLALGWTDDQVRILFQPLVTQGREAIWSMGDDAPPAYLSQIRRSLWDYCRQRFAQVTNPPIDPIREAHVMSLRSYLGPDLALPTPIIDHTQLQTLRTRLSPVCKLDMTYPASRGVAGALVALRSIEARAGSSRGMILLSDRRVSEERAVLPALLAATAAVKGAFRAGRHATPLIVETGQAFDSHHVALLIAVGAAAVHPWLALDMAEQTVAGGDTGFRSAVEQGLRKVLARMGISTLASYRNSHLFEVLGLDAEVHQEFFEDAAFALPGKSLAELLEDALARHVSAFAGTAELPDAGYYRFRKNGELHANSPDLVRKFQVHLKAVQWQGIASGISAEPGGEPVAIRDLLEFATVSPIVLDEVEPASTIVQRISTQAMSLGAISPEAHRTLALAMNRLGARSNTGEGGEDPEIYHREPEASNKVKQVASGRFGVTTEYLVQAEEIEIKMTQGSKPGEGGQLPAFKVSPLIARLRHVVPGTSLISPPPHHDIYSIEDLAQLIHDLRAVNPLARIGVKLVSGAGVGIIAVGVAKAGANVITISGHDGGTGASPLTSIKNAGLPWEVGLREAHCELTQAGLRSRVRLRVDGGLKFGRDIVIAALLGADEFGFGTAALLSIGCVMARQCHLNTCPVGIATQDEILRLRFTGKPEMVINYFLGVAAEVRQHLASLGVGTLQEVVGRVDLLRPRDCARASSVNTLLDPLPTAVEQTVPAEIQHTPLGCLDETILLRRRSSAVRLTNSDRSVGARLSGNLLRQKRVLPRSGQRLQFNFSGVAGQSFAAFLTSGVSFHLRGEANDYVAKGLSGGRVVISRGPEASLRGDVLVGNTVLYGATDGELYVAGRAGERFAVRNSGALAVVEGTGDHACEYMTAGIVLALGSTGINFGSGMTGGLAYVLRDHLRPGICNSEFVASGEIEDAEANWIARVLQQHARLTGSPVAFRLLQDSMRDQFARVQPIHLSCTVSQTWAQVLTRLKPPRRSWEPSAVLPSVTPLPVQDFPQPDAVLASPEKAEGSQISL